jgi:Rieske Fe-S protein
MRRRLAILAGLLAAPFLLAAGIFWMFLPWITPAGPGRWRLGPKSRFEKGRATFLRRAEAILVHDENGFHALSAICTHAGCTVKPANARKLLTCSCHGAAFEFDGQVARPPANVPLPRFAVFEENGELVLDTNRSG